MRPVQCNAGKLLWWWWQILRWPWMINLSAYVWRQWTCGRADDLTPTSNYENRACERRPWNRGADGWRGPALAVRRKGMSLRGQLGLRIGKQENLGVPLHRHRGSRWGTGIHQRMWGAGLQPVSAIRLPQPPAYQPNGYVLWYCWHSLE